MYWQTWFGLQGEPKTDVILLRLLFRLCVKVKERYSVKLEYFCFHPPQSSGAYAVFVCLFSRQAFLKQLNTKEASFFHPWLFHIYPVKRCNI